MAGRSPFRRGRLIISGTCGRIGNGQRSDADPYKATPKQVHAQCQNHGGFLRYHPAWPPGGLEIAAGGGADRRSAKNAAAPHGSIARSAPSGVAAPLPRGAINAYRAGWCRRQVLGAVAAFVTLRGRRPATLAADEHGRWPDRWCAAGSQDHGDDVCRRTGPAAPVGGRAGVGAVGAGHARPGRSALDGSPDDPGRPARPGRVVKARSCPRTGPLSATTVGAVLASRRPRHPVGWLLLGFALALTASGVIASYVTYGLLARPGALPAVHRSPGTTRPPAQRRSPCSASCCC